MPADAKSIKALIATELAAVRDSRVAPFIRRFLVEPQAVMRAWDYGAPDEAYLCWTVLEEPHGIGIAYCERGFGPAHPWGLVFLRGEHQSIGPDSSWFRFFLDAAYDSVMSDLPIWRVFKTDSAGTRTPISDEGEWNQTWKAVMAFRETDPSHRYDCDSSIVWR